MQMASKTRMSQFCVNITMPSRMQQETKLLHSNIATKYMAVIYSRCLTKHEHKHGKSAKDISITDLVKILTCQEITSGSHV